MEEAGFMTHTAASHQGAIQMSFVFIYSQRLNRNLIKFNI